MKIELDNQTGIYLTNVSHVLGRYSVEPIEQNLDMEFEHSAIWTDGETLFPFKLWINIGCNLLLQGIYKNIIIPFSIILFTYKFV